MYAGRKGLETLVIGGAVGWYGNQEQFGGELSRVPGYSGRCHAGTDEGITREYSETVLGKKMKVDGAFLGW